MATKQHRNEPENWDVGLPGAARRNRRRKRLEYLPMTIALCVSAVLLLVFKPAREGTIARAAHDCSVYTVCVSDGSSGHYYYCAACAEEAGKVSRYEDRNLTKRTTTSVSHILISKKVGTCYTHYDNTCRECGFYFADREDSKHLGLSTEWETEVKAYRHNKYCSVCEGYEMERCYYIGDDGKKHPIDCRDHDRTCAACGKVYYSYETFHYINPNEGGSYCSCVFCGTPFLKEACWSNGTDSACSGGGYWNYADAKNNGKGTLTTVFKYVLNGAYFDDRMLEWSEGFQNRYSYGGEGEKYNLVAVSGVSNRSSKIWYTTSSKTLWVYRTDLLSPQGDYEKSLRTHVLWLPTSDGGVLCISQNDTIGWYDTSPPEVIDCSDVSRSATYSREKSGGWTASATVSIRVKDLAYLVRVTVRDGNEKGRILSEGALRTGSSGVRESIGTYSFNTYFDANMQNGRTLHFTLTDIRGNETTYQYVIKGLDLTPPTVSLTADTTDWTNKNVTITADFADSASGVKWYGFNYKPGVYKEIKQSPKGSASHIANANGKVTFRVWDAVNSYTDKSIQIRNIDKLSPYVTAYSQSVEGGKTQVTLLGKDAEETEYNGSSGVNGYYLSSNSATPSLSDSGWKTSGTFTVGSDGTYYGWLKDKAGNISKRESVLVDTTPPVATVHYYREDTGREIAEGEWVNCPVRVVVEAVDMGSGLHDTPFSWNGGAYSDKKELVVSGEGTSQGIVAFRDKKKNSGELQYIVKIDRHAPTAEISCIYQGRHSTQAGEKSLSAVIGINRDQYASFLVSVKVKETMPAIPFAIPSETISGIRNCYLLVGNMDSMESRRFDGEISADGFSASLEFTVEETDEFFRGKLATHLYAEDLAGNVFELPDGLEVVSLYAEAVNCYNGGVSFPAGTLGRLVIRVSGYADRLTVEMPADLCKPSYEGELDDTGQKTWNSFSLSTADYRGTGIAERQMLFRIPTGTAEGTYSIKIEATKKNRSIVYNTATSRLENIESLSLILGLQVEGSILNDLKTQLR